MIASLLIAAAIAAGSDNPESRAADKRTLDETVAACRVVPMADADDYVGAYCLEDIGRRGVAAERAGPRVAEHLASPKREDRVRAATVLGMIGFRPAVPELVAATNADDWHLTMAAVRSLGWLEAGEARAAVERVARTHTLARVRGIAADALAAIDRVRESTPDFDAGQFSATNPFRLVDHPYADMRNRCEAGPWRWNGRTIERDARRVRTTIAEPRGPSRNEPWGTSGGAAAELVVDDGRLVGTNRGEWGGDLYYEADGRPARKIHSGNIVDIVRGPDGVVAVGGISHMIIDEGFFVAVERAADGYKAGRELPLPSEPRYVVPIDATAVLISTSTVNVVLRSGGRLEDADCADAAKPPTTND